MTLTAGSSLWQIDPRIRERREAVARQLGRRRFRVLAAAGGAGVLAVGAFGLLHTSLFSARHITVRGTAHMPHAKVLVAAGLSGHPPLLDVDPGRISARLARLPWVRSTVVARHWPDGVTITVRERVPVAALGDGARVAVVDATGRVLAIEHGPPRGIVALTGPGTSAPGPPGTTLPRAAAPGLAAAGALPPVLEQQVRAVSVRADGDVVLDLGGGLQALIGTVTQLGEKYEALASVLAGARVAGPATIDLTVPDEPAVSPG